MIIENSVVSNCSQAIAYYDENRDGVINSNEEFYRVLKKWQDKNQNGTMADGELLTISQARNKSINVAYENINETD